jgi:Cu+-exporting ATPase
LGFNEPCSVGSHLLFIKYLEGRPGPSKLTQTAEFTLSRSLFLGLLGAAAALIGKRFLGLQQAFWLLLGAAGDEREALRVAAAMESASEHPLARAIVAEAEARQLQVPAARNFQAATEKGVAATVEGRHALVGSHRFMETQGIAVEAAREQIEALQAAANTVVALAVDGRPAGLIAIADRLKTDAVEAVARMRGAGLEPVMLTGDNARTAQAVAERVGITVYRADVLPEDKAAAVRDLQGRGYRVAMVGDGINDGPALMQADVGMAIGAGTDIAIESADVVLIGERLGAVVDAFFIGKSWYRKTVQNLSLAFAFNGIGVPLAVTGLVHPAWAMVAMVASVTTVLTNSFGGRLLPKARRGRTNRVTFEVLSMHCEHCLASIRDAVCKLDGVEDVVGNPQEQLVTVTYREELVSPGGIREAIVERGFRVAPSHASGNPPRGD